MSVILTDHRPRRVLARLIRRFSNETTQAQAATADAFIDHALDTMELEEPALRDLLDHDDELNRVFAATAAAMSALAARDKANGIPWLTTLYRLDRLYRRTTYAAALTAVMNERDRR